MMRLKVLRIQNGITQKQLAGSVGISQPYLSELERGRKDNPSVALLKRLASVLGVNMYRLFEENSTEPEVIQHAAD